MKKKIFVNLSILAIILSYTVSAFDIEKTDFEVTSLYQDNSTGFKWGRVHYIEDENHIYRPIVYYNDKWNYLLDKWREIYSCEFDGYVIADERESYKYCYLDIKNNEIIDGNIYNISPNKKWGFVCYKNYSNESSSNKYNYYIKNIEKGDITNIDSNNHNMSMYWLNDNNFIYCKYSEEDKQNAIFIYNPDTKKTNKLILGTLLYYNNELDEIFFLRNVPGGGYYTYNFNKGNEVYCEYNSSTYKMYTKYIYSNSNYKKIPIPEDLEPRDLPVWEPKIVKKYEHNVCINNKTYPVDYVVTIEGTKYIPIRALMEPLKINVQIKIDENISNSLYNKTYTVTYLDKSYILEEDEYKITNLRLDWMLCLTPKAFERIGLGEIEISPNN